ncbi:MAG: TonB-dependent receptor [Xanthomonadaceae bacterium]|nr:TonB-dependent receptor [Xanthomonadaceae bacterium]
MSRTLQARRPYRRATLFTALACALVAQAVALPALAQDTPRPADEELDRIIVTAQKREQQIEDVPIAINAYSGEFLEAQGIVDYGDLGSLVPGLEVQTQSVSNPSISIRGITADLDDPTQEPRISLFQDGVSISRARGSSVEMFDLQRIEVLRGPQGTLFGRAAETGAIHIIQNKAREGRSGSFELGLGSDDQRRFTGHFNTDLGENVQGRIAAFYETRDGYMDNLDGGSLQGKDTRAIRGALHFDIGEASGIDVILNYQKDTPPGTGFRSQVIPNLEGSLDPYTANSQRGNDLGTDRDVYGATVLGDFVLNDNWSLSTITGWRRFDGLDKFDADGSQADLIEFDEDARGRQFSQEFRFNYDAGGKFTGFLGTSFFDETSERDLHYQADERQLYALLSREINTNTSALLGPTLANYYFPIVPLLNPNATPNTSVATTWLPVPGVVPSTPANPAGFLQIPLNPDHRESFGNDVDIRAIELFADGTWQFNDQWSLTLGLRGSHEKVEYGYFAAPGNGSSLGFLLSARGEPACGAPPCTNLLFPATAGRLSAGDSFTSWVGRAVLGFRVSDTINTYASISRGRRPAMINVSDVTPEGEEIPAEIVWSYELGMKGSAADGRFVYDLSLFYYDYNNFQASVQNDSPPPFFVTTNAGKAHALGFEASLFARFSDNVNGWFNYGYIDGGFNAFDDDGTYQELAGNRFRMTPKQSVSLGLDWTIPLSNGDSLYVRPSWNWRGHVYFEDENQPGIEQDSYGLLNLRMGWRFNQNWDVGLWGNNLTDEEYLIDAGNTGLLFGIPTVIPGPDRSYGVSLRAKF